MRLAPPDPDTLRRAVGAALAEDLGERGDITSAAVVPAEAEARASLVARERMVVAGLAAAREVFRQIDATIAFVPLVDEGAAVEADTVVARASGRARALLAGERTALNFLQRMSGIATATRDAVAEIEGTGAVVLDTRKTVPGLRRLDKHAVEAGGGVNHRMGLHDAAMVKDTHLGVGGSLGDAVRACLAAGIPREAITAEVRDERELAEAIEAGAGRALLDNMDLGLLAACVARGRGRIVLEASGGLRPGALRPVAETGVDALSLGYLTHSVRAADLAMDLEPLPRGDR
ncbi:MAG TPA: carboxylating nicotinate-nucleotide diphosphorylase [Candidatus Polarisedimenticolaceae bacterium]|nr:carboxylating nicotinate-nucleotide diphosphorylase [Candidatus Polarisedimenticolaceae bacterium]